MGGGGIFGEEVFVGSGINVSVGFHFLEEIDEGLDGIVV